MRQLVVTLVAVLALTTTLSSCRADAGRQDAAAPAVGFVFVGRGDDLGYNEAAYDGSVAVGRAFPEHRVLRAYDVPEDGRAVATMEAQIAAGAKVVFATSFGHRDAAIEVARRHPDVVVVHQGNAMANLDLPNFGTYYGTFYEPVYLAGIVAGRASRSGRLGMIAAFPIAPVLNTVNAFVLGARSVNPQARLTVRFTGSWCDPVAQERVASELLAAGVEVLSQHQDCTRAILEAADRAGALSIGYHYDASDVVPRSWLAGAVWSWDDLYTDITRVALSGRFAGSAYNGNFRGRTVTGDNPFLLTELGPAVPADTRGLVDAAAARFGAGASPFDGPVVDGDGVVRVPAGSRPTEDELERMAYLVEGVRTDGPAWTG